MLFNQRSVSEKHSFQKAVEKRDLVALSASLAENVVFYTPVTPEPYQGRQKVMSVLSLAAKIFVFKDSFSYTNSFCEGNILLLMFRARVGEHEIDGIDYFELDKDDRVCVLRVMMRPLVAVEAIAQRTIEMREEETPLF